MKKNPSQTSGAELMTAAAQHHKFSLPVHRGLNLVGLLTAAVWLLAAAVAPAQTDAWSGASGTDLNWSTSGNWFGGLPGPTSNVLFQDDGANGTTGPGGTVDNTVDTNTVIQSLQVRKHQRQPQHTDSCGRHAYRQQRRLRHNRAGGHGD